MLCIATVTASHFLRRTAFFVVKNSVLKADMISYNYDFHPFRCRFKHDLKPRVPLILSVGRKSQRYHNNYGDKPEQKHQQSGLLTNIGIICV